MSKPIVETRIQEGVKYEHTLTDAEHKECSLELANRLQQIEAKEAAIAAASATAKAEIRSLKAGIMELVRQTSSGKADRSSRCRVEFHAKKGIKKYYLDKPGQSDDGELIKTENMTESEMSSVGLFAKAEDQTDETEGSLDE